MLKKAIYIGIYAIFLAIGLTLTHYLLGPWILADYPNFYKAGNIIIPIIFIFLGIFLAPLIFRLFENILNKLVAPFNKMSIIDIICTVFGLIAGLIIASLLGASVSRIKVVGPYLSIFLVILFGYVGFVVGSKKRDDFRHFINTISLRGRGERQSKNEPLSGAISRGTMPKILDTSVIIDGRIADIYKTGFIEGDLIVPNFVLEELRHIADSSDSLKRNRGRRGLDILNKMRQGLDGRVLISEVDYPDIAEVDSKLVRLAQELGGMVVTNDFNLNKVAQLQDVKVLNINELSNAVKPVVLPGEEMTVQIIKDGKESGQGIAYLDDGTMIVVEGGRKFYNKTICVIVTSVLQTSAGKMIFARPKYGKGETGELVCK